MKFAICEKSKSLFWSVSAAQLDNSVHVRVNVLWSFPSLLIFILSYSLGTTNCFHKMCSSGILLHIIFENFHGQDILQKKKVNSKAGRFLQRVRCALKRPVWLFILSLHSFPEETFKKELKNGENQTLVSLPLLSLFSGIPGADCVLGLPLSLSLGNIRTRSPIPFTPQVTFCKMARKEG